MKIETKTSTGPGGQHANKIQTAVRLYHLPTGMFWLIAKLLNYILRTRPVKTFSCFLSLGIIIECQTSRSQTQNKKLAMQKLRSKLFQMECEKRDSKVDSVRKFQV